MMRRNIRKENDLLTKSGDAFLFELYRRI